MSRHWALHKEMTAASIARLPVPSPLLCTQQEWARLTTEMSANEPSDDSGHDEAIILFTELMAEIRAAMHSQTLLSNLIQRNHELLGAECCNDPEWVTASASNPTILLDNLQNELDTLKKAQPPGARLLGRKRPDGVAINWTAKKLFLLEFTRCWDSEADALALTDSYKIGKYKSLVTAMLQCLGDSWAGGTLSFTMGARGSVHVETWERNMTALGLGPAEKVHVLTGSVDAALEALDILFTARSAALYQAKT
jgi:hypothetical protein